MEFSLLSALSTSPLGLLPRNLQLLLAPDAFHPFVIDLPTLSPEQGGDMAITVTPIPFAKLNNLVLQSPSMVLSGNYRKRTSTGKQAITSRHATQLYSSTTHAAKLSACHRRATLVKSLEVDLHEPGLERFLEHLFVGPGRNIDIF